MKQKIEGGEKENNRLENLESEVNIRKASNGYIIDVNDRFTKNNIAVTKEELEKIIIYGQAILK